MCTLAYASFPYTLHCMCVSLRLPCFLSCCAHTFSATSSSHLSAYFCLSLHPLLFSPIYICLSSQAAESTAETIELDGDDDDDDDDKEEVVVKKKGRPANKKSQPTSDSDQSQSGKGKGKEKGAKTSKSGKGGKNGGSKKEEKEKEEGKEEKEKDNEKEKSKKSSKAGGELVLLRGH